MDQSEYSLDEKEVAISALNQDFKPSPDHNSTLLNSANKDPNAASKKLYEMSDIYSTMKINDTPESEADGKDNQAFAGFLEDCLKSQENTMIEHENVSSSHNIQIISPAIEASPEMSIHKISAKNQQNSIDTVHIFESKKSQSKEHQRDSATFWNPEKESDKSHVIQQQNLIIDNLTKEISDLKARLSCEQKDKFKISIELEQIKRFYNNPKKKVNKETMTTAPFKQVIVYP